LVDIFYPQNFGDFEKKGLFQQTRLQQLITTIDRQLPVCPLLILGIMLALSCPGQNSERIKGKSCSKSVRLLSQFSWLAFYAVRL
jgi:hypothetical protein